MDELEQNLIEMAKEWKIDQNQLLQSSISQYAMQRKIIDKVMLSILNEDNDMTNQSTNKYTTTTTNTANPLIRELPKLSDSANRTAQTILKIITNLGTEPEKKTETNLEKFLHAFDEEDEDDGTEEKE